MSLSFTKLFSSITESTVWMQPPSVKVVWITMLAMADRHGRVHASIPGLACRAHVSLQETEHALQVFLSPDSYSRTKDFEGRRIEAIDGGWHLLNYAKYREIQDADSRRESKRRWWNENRGTGLDVTRQDSNELDELDEARLCASASSSASGSGSGSGSEGSAEGVEVVNPRKGRFVPADWKPNDGHRGRCLELCLPLAELEQAYRDHEFNRDYADWDRRFSKWITDERNKRDTERAKLARMGQRGAQAPTPVDWKPKDAHERYCKKFGLELATAAADFVAKGQLERYPAKELDEVFGRWLANLARAKRKESAA